METETERNRTMDNKRFAVLLSRFVVPEMTSQLESVEREYKEKKELLIDKMRFMARELSDTANRWMNDDDRRPSSCGIIQSSGIDMMCAEVHTLANTIACLDGAIEYVKAHL